MPQDEEVKENEGMEGLEDLSETPAEEETAPEADDMAGDDMNAEV
ncbi:MAG TPA: hypothetical protein PKZ16_02940 [bacterium]|nr:hypothetical protein [bacterium]HPL95173.1 hypothetical protein [bacterium]